MNTTMKNNTNIQYRQVGDFNIPNLILPAEETNITLGKWGMLHKDYLLKNKKALFTTLLTRGKLYQHCAEIEKQANKMVAIYEKMGLSFAQKGTFDKEEVNKFAAPEYFSEKEICLFNCINWLQKMMLRHIAKKNGCKKPLDDKPYQVKK